MNKNTRYALFATLYLAQGAIMSYFTSLNALYLQSYGLGLDRIGLIGTIAMIPFVLKIFFGLLSDKVSFFHLGHRKPYILIGLTIQILGLLLVPLINPAKNFSLWALNAFFLMAGMALYDTCTDGLALDTTAPEDEGKIQGIMVAGRALGMVLISSILGLLVDKISWTAAFFSLAVLTAVPIPLVLKTREAEETVKKEFNWAAFKEFKKFAIIALGLLGALYSLIINGTSQLVNPFLEQQFTISYTTAGIVASVLGVGIVVGSLAGGKLVDRIGQKKSVQLSLLVTLISVAVLSLINTPLTAWILVFVFGLAFGLYETVYFAIAMRETNQHIAATMFSILMAVANLGTGIGLGLSGVLAEGFGYKTAFFILALLNLLAIPLLPAIFGKKRNSNLATD
ncbi:MAG: MFS transporter [Chloroflexi bacterium]|nr:MFS transporter [Chloroflexota bacterium]